MIRVFGEIEPFRFQQCRNMLDEAGISYIVKNEFVQGGAGELPLVDITPEIWLLDPSDLPRTQRLIATLPDGNGSDWICTTCSESNGASFEVCWQCGAEYEDRLAR